MSISPVGITYPDLIQTIATCVQTIGVVAALAFGAYQLRGARKAIEASVRGEITQIYMQIHQSALQFPEIAGEYAGLKRLHLMRIHYFFRVHSLHEQGFLDDEEYVANAAYLKWLCVQEQFLEVWRSLEEQYNLSFRKWINDQLSTMEELKLKAP
jgi:hypothetical protein